MSAVSMSFVSQWSRPAVRSIAVLAGLLACIADLSAQRSRRGLPLDKGRNHVSVRASMGVLAEAVRGSVVKVLDGTKVVAYGTVVAEDGVVVTKASEIRRARSLQCELADGTRIVARRIGEDAAADLAVLQVRAASVQAVRWVDQAPVVARMLATVGTEDVPLAMGVVSLPVYEPKGRRTRSNRQPGRLGVTYRVGAEEARISRVRRASAASQAGLRSGDVILELSGVAISSAGGMADAIQKHFAGDKVAVVIRRNGEEQTLEVVLDAAPRQRRGASRSERLWGDLSAVRSGFPRVLQHDTVLKPEQCGSPVVTLDGRVAGINIARVGRVESWALPADLVQEVVTRILAEDSGR